MKLKTVVQAIPAEFRYLLDTADLDLESGVSIPIRFKTPTTKRFLSATSHPLMSQQKAVKVAKKSEGVKYLTGSVKTVTHGRSLKYPTETLFLLDEVKTS
ncbi:hypothetical protein F442_00541 [Phytophthora nicotianae P10297]|uniref:Uncharacterized protein n=1 Tax=Phytophthora nicotianae P10297 TaxID=1317064 RepID=W3A5D9_PHYNI|nr:hypothetical protein F442_00541 [Phytophthora nicotianae P10297]